MQLGPFFTGQIPREPLSFVVRDSATDTVVDLSDYTAVSVVIVDPDGELVDTSDGTASLPNPEGGEVRYVWPSTALFTTPGDYELQVRLTATGAVDLTVPARFEVFRALGA